MRTLGFFFMFVMFCSCITNSNSYVETKEYSELNKVIVDSFLISNLDVFKMQMKVQGEMDGKGLFVYGYDVYNSDINDFRKRNYVGVCYSTPIKLEGHIDKTIRSDWYEQKCYIKYKPIDSLVTGKITISFEVEYFKSAKLKKHDIGSCSTR